MLLVTIDDDNFKMTPHIEIIKQFYSGLNRNDVDAVLKLLHPDIIRTEFEESPTGGTYRGHDELRNHIIKGRSTWAEGECKPTEFFTEKNKTVVIVHVKVRLKNESKWIEGQVADCFSVADEQITEFNSYTTQDKAFEWAGITVKN